MDGRGPVGMILRLEDVPANDPSDAEGRESYVKFSAGNSYPMYRHGRGQKSP